jgi:dihydrofolate synthase/folylpolyglutamate synthase
MTYTESLEYIHSTLKFGSKLGFERISRLLELMGNPQDSLKFIHVAGTNGKGSTCNAIAAALKTAGYKTGLYTSPFINDFCERIQIDNENIPHDELAKITNQVKSYADKISQTGDYPTEFELVTAIAFDFFQKSGCDIVVLEVGLGGRFDATNIIKTPLISVITSISLDHTEILGETEAEIAFEKCGIIKDKGITISSPEQSIEALEVIMRSCAEHGNTLFTPILNAVKLKYESIDGSEIEYKNNSIFIPLAGKHQIINFITAFEVVDILRNRYGFNISSDNIIKGFSEVRFAARMEILHRDPLIILDGAHNPAGAKALANSIKNYLSGKNIVVIMGMFKDKDYKFCIAEIAALANSFIAIESHSPRALPTYEVAFEAQKYCANVTTCNDYSQALIKAQKSAGSDGVIIICGSLYFAGEMKQLINNNQII